MYLYKATCPDIPNPKQKGPRGQGGPQVQVQGPGHARLAGQNSTGASPRAAAPVMLWSTSRGSGAAEVKQLEEFLNFHALSLQDTVKSRTGMIYR